MTAERKCPICRAPESEIAERGHRELDGLGRPVAADTMTSTPCPEACSCSPPCFNMDVHRMFEADNEALYQAAQAKKLN